MRSPIVCLVSKPDGVLSYPKDSDNPDSASFDSLAALAKPFKCSSAFWTIFTVAHAATPIAASAAITGNSGVIIAAIPAPPAAAALAAAAPGMILVARPPIADPMPVPLSIVAARMTDSMAIAKPLIF